MICLVKVMKGVLVATVSAVATFPAAALAEQLSRAASVRIMEKGEILVSQATRWEASDFGGNRGMATAFEARPDFNFVVRTTLGITDEEGNLIPAGLFYCRVGQSPDMVTFAVCSDSHYPTASE